MEDKRTLTTPARSLVSGLSLRTNFSWTFVGNVVYAACQWGMLAALAHLSSPGTVGQFSLGLAVTAPIMMCTRMELAFVQATDAKREYSFGDYLGLRLITTALALLAIAGIVITVGYRHETALVILAVGIAKAIESISDVFYGLLQQRERMDRIAKSKMIKGVLSLAALSVAVSLVDSVLWGALALAVGWTLVLIGYDIRSGALILETCPQRSDVAPDQDNQRMALRPHWEARTLARLARLALPLGFVMMLDALNYNIPRYFIEQHMGERELGIYSAIAYLQNVGITVVFALGQSASPQLAKHYAAGNARAFRTLLLKLVGVGVLLGVGGVLVSLVAGREVLTLLYRPEYAERDLFVLLMVASVGVYVALFLGYGMIAARYLRAQMPLFAFVTGTAALACFLLVPSLGLYGAALAAIITAVVQAIGSAIIVMCALRALA